MEAEAAGVVEAEVVVEEAEVAAVVAVAVAVAAVVAEVVAVAEGTGSERQRAEAWSPGGADRPHKVEQTGRRVDGYEKPPSVAGEMALAVPPKSEPSQVNWRLTTPPDGGVPNTS